MHVDENVTAFLREDASLLLLQLSYLKSMQAMLASTAHPQLVDNKPTNSSWEKSKVKLTDYRWTRRQELACSQKGSSRLQWNK
eukprot:scaffold147672_cov13-Tisochrysis_lutea.AAC.1